MDHVEIIRCVKCGERVSDTAEACPLCGAKIKIKSEPKSLLAKTAPWVLWLSLVANVVQYTIAEKRQTAEAVRVADMSGAQTFAEACKDCHNSRKPLNNLRLTKEQWKEALERMANYRHRVPEAKLPGLLDYLVARTPAAPGPAKQ
jgi:DNA-directed RNA polymerase subunit RPC12/RpoP